MRNSQKQWLIHGNLRERCMDLVSFESPQEYRHFATMMYYGELLIWLGGRIILKVEIIKKELLKNSNTTAYSPINFDRQREFYPHIGEKVQLPEQGL